MEISHFYIDKHIMSYNIVGNLQVCILQLHFHIVYHYIKQQNSGY